MHVKISSIDRGIIPLWGPWSHEPSIVYVLPVPVWPYAITAALYPCRVECTAGRAAVSYTVCCVVSWSNTRSNVNLQGVCGVREVAVVLGMVKKG